MIVGRIKRSAAPAELRSQLPERRRLAPRSGLLIGETRSLDESSSAAGRDSIGLESSRKTSHSRLKSI
jgi:hypothetical protein